MKFVSVRPDDPNWDPTEPTHHTSNGEVKCSVCQMSILEYMPYQRWCWASASKGDARIAVIRAHYDCVRLLEHFNTEEKWTDGVWSDLVDLMSDEEARAFAAGCADPSVARAILGRIG